VCQLLGTLCVALALALLALDGVDLTGGFCLRTPNFSRPTAIVGPVLDTVIVSHVVEGVVCEE
jgi:glucokinase